MNNIVTPKQLPKIDNENATDIDRQMYLVMKDCELRSPQPSGLSYTLKKADGSFKVLQGTSRSDALREACDHA